MHSLDQTAQHWRDNWLVVTSKPAYKILHQEISEELLRNRVLEIRSALFHNMGNTPKRFSTQLVDVVGVDAVGQLCFEISCPAFLSLDEIFFPARLDLYQKGLPYFLQITGTAKLYPEKRKNRFRKICDHYFQQEAKLQRVLVRMQIEMVHYEDWSDSPHGFFDKMRSALYAWL